jgi:hypothetical protein
LSERLPVTRTTFTPFTKCFNAPRGITHNPSNLPISELRHLRAVNPNRARGTKGRLFEKYLLATRRIAGQKNERLKKNKAHTLGERPFAADHPNVAAFFKSFQEDGFTFDPEQGIPAEFRRLRRHLEFKFKKAHPKRKELEERYEKAMDKDFEYMFGKDFNDIVAWQRIFKRIGVNPLPNMVEEAKKVREYFLSAP